MEPILSKEEIADLLTALKTGKISTDSVDDKHVQAPRFLLAKEIDLFQTYQHGGATGEMRIPNFDIIIDMFARNFGTTLTNTLQKTFLVERQDITSTSFQQSLQNLNNQGAVGIFNTDPLKYGCLFHFDTFMAFTLLEIMLGSTSNESMNVSRTLTTIEISILRNTMEGIGKDLQKALQPITPVQPSLTKIENNFRLVNIVEADTEVLVATFNLSASGERAGQMCFIIPYLTVEPFREAFREMVTVTQASSNWNKIITREALEMECMVIARSGLIDMTIRKILQLKKGDIIDLGYDPTQPISIVVENQPKFRAIPGERNGKKAFHITGLTLTN
ncbi:flagellar motor switch protein FliM [Desulfogranum japonicum]|uniref:flagellar motor switch protein FliM n=1 Tax=Desulfogranum japonicum TaxID=231447 RepID=UPI0003FCDAD3|nr:FliM/FliN family flagellar motor switch protein [Desulfogranum japonicum]